MSRMFFKCVGALGQGSHHPSLFFFVPQAGLTVVSFWENPPTFITCVHATYTCTMEEPVMSKYHPILTKKYVQNNLNTKNLVI